MLPFNAYVAKVRQTIVEVNVEELASRKNPDYILIDVREPDEWAKGIIAGAICIPRGVLEKQLEVYLNEHSSFGNGETPDIILYCQSGARSALAARSLADMGLSGVQSLAGGVAAWSEKKYPFVSNN